MRGALPSGTVTFLFTDLEGSTSLWDVAPVAMSEALAAHDRLVRHAVEVSGGEVFASMGDGFAAVFTDPAAAARAAVAAQIALQDEAWPDGVRLRVRMGLHCGVAEVRDGSFFGSTVNRAARVAAAAQAGQVLVSAAAAGLLADAGWDLVEVGAYRLKGFARVERLYRLRAPGLADVEAPVRVDAAVVGNLGSVRQQLIGREDDVAAVVARLQPGALVTVTGGGGVGKTVLALASARAVSRELFVDGVWLLPLAEVAAPADVVAFVASSLGLRTWGERVSTDAIAEVLGPQHRLVILDNCEHLIEVAADLADTILERCPGVALLATSRQPLGCDGEHVYPLATLSVDRVQGMSVAAQLLVDRMYRATGRVDLTPTEHAAAEAICQRLDGLPLAIELAAARIPAFGLEGVLDRLGRSLEVLARRRGPSRHSSVTAVVQWSFDLLAADAQRLFERLSVFSGGFDTAMAAAVCGFDPIAAELDVPLASLVEHSLVHMTGVAPVRYALLEPVRQAAEALLHERGEGTLLRDRHLTGFVGFAEAASAGLRGPDEPAWNDRLQAERENLRAALRHAIATGDSDAACRLVCAVGMWAGDRFDLDVGEWAEAVVAMPAAAVHRLFPSVCSFAAQIAGIRGDDARLAQLLELRSGHQARLDGDPEPIVLFGETYPYLFRDPDELRVRVDRLRTRVDGDAYWNAMGDLAELTSVIAALNLGEIPDRDIPDTLARFDDFIADAERVGSPSLIARAKGWKGAALRSLSPTEALPLLESALLVVEALGADYLASEILNDLGPLYAELGRPHEALTHLRPRIERLRRAGAHAQAARAATNALPALGLLGHPDLVCIGFGRLQRRSGRRGARYILGPSAEPTARRNVGDDEADRLEALGASIPHTTYTEMVLDAISQHTT